MRKNNLLVSLKGFTLIELLIAITIFLIGIMAAFSLTLNNLNNAKENSNRVIAADLAREGIEIVRNIRDSNWLAREANIDDISSGLLISWDHGLDVGNFKVAYDVNNLILFTTMPVDLSSAINETSATLYLNNGFYTHSNIGGQATLFRRAINIQAIYLCAESGLETMNSAAICVDALEKIGFQITSRVRYTYGSRTNTIDAVENIYNWRQ
jgi:prepilin-type N-terminal cleavage/methylation domain-containing protein